MKKSISGLLFLIGVLSNSIQVDSQVFAGKIGIPVQVGQFRYPSGIGVDASGNIYFCDGNNKIMKFASDGAFILEWGSTGSGDGQFINPIDLAIDQSGNVFVIDEANSRVQKFDSQGIFIKKWGHAGFEDGLFWNMRSIEIDNVGNVYVGDSQRIQKFSNSGDFILKWNSGSSYGIAIDGSNNVFVLDADYAVVRKFDSSGNLLTIWGGPGSDPGLFSQPTDITVDNLGTAVYVSEGVSGRIQKFSGTGTFFNQWGSEGLENGQFSVVKGITVDVNGNVLVSDTFNHRIQIFNSEGTWLSNLLTPPLDGQFTSPRDLCIDNHNNLLVTDVEDDQIQKFSADLSFISKWGASGTSDGKFDRPFGIITDKDDNIYVADFDNHRIQKFNSQGEFILKWGNFGSANGEFNSPTGLAIDKNGDIYVSEFNNHRIQKFSSSGIYLSSWGGIGSADGEFNSPRGIAIDAKDNIYVVDGTNSRIQKFNSAGIFLLKWGSTGFENGQFNNPRGIAIDANDRVFVGDYNNGIQIFTNTGTFLGKWGGGDGSFGSANGEFNGPAGIAIDTEGSVYVADQNNDRVQKFYFPNTITTFSPTFGPPGTVVNIGGTNFSTTLANNIVKFNGTLATVTESSPTLITVIVPEGVTKGPISITVNGLTSFSLSNFSLTEEIVIPPTPAITGFSPVSGAVGETVVLTGANFDPIATNNVVKFNGVNAVVTSGTITSISTIVPAGATTGTITLSIGDITATSPVNFVVTIVTGDIENELNNELQLYPNPARTEIVVGLENFEKGLTVVVEIFDLNGCRIENKSGIGGRKFSIDIKNFSPGKYILKAAQGKKNYFKQFIKE